MFRRPTAKTRWMSPSERTRRWLRYGASGRVTRRQREHAHRAVILGRRHHAHVIAYEARLPRRRKCRSKSVGHIHHSFRRHRLDPSRPADMAAHKCHLLEHRIKQWEYRSEMAAQPQAERRRQFERREWQFGDRPLQLERTVRSGFGVLDDHVKPIAPGVAEVDCRTVALESAPDRA